MRTVGIVVIIALCWLGCPRGVHAVPSEVRPDDLTGPDEDRWATTLELKQPEAPMTDAQMLRNVRMQRSGHVLLGIGLGVIVAGVALVEVDAYGKIGLAGFASLGSGITIMTVAMALLGFSRPVHYRELDRHEVAAWRPSNGGGLVVSYGVKL